MTGSDDNLQTTDFRPDGLAVRLFDGPRDPSYLRVVAAFVLASASHLWLADAADPEWFESNVIYVVGLLLLVVSRGAIGWIACSVALLIPLLFLRDQLTQSALLLAVASAGALATMRRPARPESLRRVARGLLITTYGLAAFHKLNHDFFDPAVGCATYGLRELAEYYRLAPDAFVAFSDAHGALAVALELAIPLAYLLGRRHIARLLAVVFHIPLTLTMAPAFAFVMFVGHAAYVTDEDARQFRAVWKRFRLPMILAAVATTAASLGAHGAWPEWTMVPREWLLWLALYWCGLVLVFEGRSVREPQPPGRGVMPTVVVAAFLFNGLTPYLGLQFQHTGAMLSNLRIDEGCWNHLVVPEAMRLTEDYIRVDAVMFGTPEKLPDYQETVLNQLWSPPQFRQMRINWCRADVRPFELRGTFRGETWHIQDLCDPEEPWPFAGDGIVGVEIFGNFLRFQKNLERKCPQACIH